MFCAVFAKNPESIRYFQEVISMGQIRVSDLTFYYDNSFMNVFEDVSLVLDTDWKLGFVGRNGRGKTTFLNLLMGKYEHRGSINSPVDFDYFPYIVEEKDIEKDTIDVVELMDPNYEFWRVNRELNLLKMDSEVLYRPFCTLSGGEQTRVMLAVLFSREEHFLLIDEPTNHLDHQGRALVRDYLNKKQGYILVSHDRWFLDGCIDHVLAINKMDIMVCQGTFSTWWENKKRQDAYEAAENEKLRGEVRKLEKAARQAAGWSDQVEQSKLAGKKANHQENRGFFDRGAVGHKAAKMMKRSKSLENRRNQALEEKSALLKNVEVVDKLQIRPLYHHKEVLIRMENLSLFYGKQQIIKDLDLEIHNGQRVVLTGANGSGKSSLIKLLLGESIHTTGICEIASGLKISYVSQDTSHLAGSLEDFITLHQLDGTLFRTILRKLDLEREQFGKEMSRYSAGQKKKVLLAKSLCEEAHLYIWDEPLNYIDIFSRMQLEELLEQYQPTMLLVEHDRMFVERLVDVVIELGER